MTKPIITLLTDFGSRDHYVAAMKGVILSLCPEANIVDITHQVPAFRIAWGGYTLTQAASTFPAGAIHVAVVDPGVGGGRRALAAQAGAHVFIGPDNGLLAPALESAGSAKVFEIVNPQLCRHPVSRTFHGRDIFAPAAAHFACGVPVAHAGPAVTDWHRGEVLRPRPLGPCQWEAQILSIDRFGNVITNFSWADFSDVSRRPFRLRLGSANIEVFAETYEAAPVNRPFLIRGSGDFLEICIKQGNAAAWISPRADEVVALEYYL